MKHKKMLLTILSAFALLFLLTACKGKKEGTWDAKKTTYDSPEAKVTFTKIDPIGFLFDKGTEVCYYFEITNKTESEKTVGDLINGVIDTVKQGNKNLEPTLSRSSEVELNKKVKPNQKVAAQIDYEVKDPKLAVDMVFANGEHFKLTQDDLRDRAQQEYDKRSRQVRQESDTLEKALEHIKTAPGKFNWTLKQYDDLKDDSDLNNEKLEDILKDHPTPLTKEMDDLSIVLTYGNAKNEGPTVVLTFMVDSEGEVRLISKEQTGLD